MPSPIFVKPDRVSNLPISLLSSSLLRRLKTSHQPLLATLRSKNLLFQIFPEKPNHRARIGFSYGKPPALANYTVPSHCPSREFSKIVLEFKATCQGRQFDRIFGVWLDGVEILRSCTAEPSANGIIWSVEKDVTRYHSILVKNETQILSVYLGNLVDKTYTGVYHVDVVFHFYPFEKDLRSSGYISPQADMILPISRNLPLNDGLWFEIMNSNDSQYKDIEIPRNAYRAVLEVYVSFHENDEFWYGSNEPFREVVVSLDGKIAGAVWPFPVIFTGGINPLLWRPITAIGSFDLPTYDIEITPFLGNLLDGKTHKLGFNVTNALNVWYIDANLHLWLDQKLQIVEGKVLEVSRNPLHISPVSEFKGLNGNFTTKTNRSITSVGLVKSSHGDIITNASQEFSYVNTMVLDGHLQIVDQLIQANDSVQVKRDSKEIFALKSIKNFPLYLHFDNLEQQDNTSMRISNITMGFNEERSESDYELMRSFESKLKNKQDGQAVLVVKDRLVISGHGSTQQVYKYIGPEQCYFRNISSSNTILYDKIETVCKKKMLKHLTEQPLLA